MRIRFPYRAHTTSACWLVMTVTPAVCRQSLGAGVSGAKHRERRGGPKPKAVSKAPSPFSEAESLFQQGSLEEAKSQTLELLRRYPSDPVGYKLMGIIYSEQKDYA